MGAPSLLCCPSSDLGSSPALPFLPWSSEVEEGHNQSPFPRLGVGCPQTSSERPHGHLPALCHLLGTPHHGVAHRCSHPSSHLGASHLSCQKCFTPCPLRRAPAFRLLPLPTSAKSSAALGPSGVVSSGWWAPSRAQRYPKLIASCPCPSSDNEKSSRAAASLLGNMWQYTKLHRDFKMVCTTPRCLLQPVGSWDGSRGWIPRESRPGASSWKATPPKCFQAYDGPQLHASPS